MAKKKMILFACCCVQQGHKINVATKIGRYINKVITTQGETIPITTNGKTFHAVPRIYLLIHGLRGQEVKTFPIIKQ